MKFKLIVLNLIIALVFLVSAFAVPRVSYALESDELVANTTIMTNNVIVIKFSDNDTFPSSEYLQKLDAMYNTSEISMRNYFLQSSLNKLCVNTEIISGNSAIILDNPFEYYMPRYEYDEFWNAYKDVNYIGYDNRFFYNGAPVSPSTAGAVEHIERIAREQQLLREVIAKTNAKLNNADSDGDGEIDSITLILDLKQEDYDTISWNNALWPHMSKAYNLTERLVKSNNYVPSGYYETHIKNMSSEVYLDDLLVSDYNFLTTLYIDKYQLDGDYKGLSNVGVLCHEFYHTLGLFDYYSYTNTLYQSVGEVDILGVTQPLPQMSLCYNRQKLGWLCEGENVLPIEKSGRYTLSAVTSDDVVKAYKLVLNDYAETGEYFMIEMRSNMGNGFDSLLSESGIIVYRVNEKNGFIDDKGQYSSVCYGNMYSSMGSEEIFVYRHGGRQSLNASSGKSLAILNGSKTIDGYTFVKDRLGSTDKNLSSRIYSYNGQSGIAGLNTRYYNTTIYYGNLKNSGVAITNITLNDKYDSATFDIEFDDFSQQISVDDGFNLEKTLDGKMQVSWQSGARIGNVKLLALEYDDALIGEMNGSSYAKTLPTVNDFNLGQMSGYKTVISKTVPVSFKKATFETERDCVIYALISDGENEIVKFVGVAKTQNDPRDTLDRIINHKYFKIAVVVIVASLVFVVVTAILSVIVKKVKR